MALESLLPDVQAERAKYGTEMTADQCVELLNAVAWKNKDKGWGLGQKTSGSYGRRKDSKTFSTDGLVHKDTMTFVDALVDSGAGGGVPNNPGLAKPAWQVASNPSNRPWVAPIDPGTGPTPPPPSTDLEKEVAKLKVENAQQRADIAALRSDLSKVQVDLIALKEALDNIQLPPGLDINAILKAVVDNIRTESRQIALNHDHALVIKEP